MVSVHVLGKEGRELGKTKSGRRRKMYLCQASEETFATIAQKIPKSF